MQHNASLSNDCLRVDEATTRKYALLAGAVGLVCLAVAIGFSFTSGEQFWRAYIANFCFLTAITLGALFFVLVHHLTRAGWSVVVRRVPELMTSCFPLLALMAVPIVLMLLFRAGPIGAIYPWADPDYVAHSHVLQGKTAYLNPWFFTLRVAFYFVLWSLLAMSFLQRSLRQDETGDPELTLKMQWLSAPAMLLFALSTTFFAVDFLMSLAPSWYSTIFGVYYFAGCYLSFCAFVILVFVSLQAGGVARTVISREHYHDLGKWMFAFTVFWTYIGFSQYMLQWYGNIPEETQFYYVRQKAPWLYISFALLFAGFVIPFVGIISRVPKRTLPLLAAWAAWILVVRWLDVLWLVMPPYWGKLEAGKTTLFEPVSLILAALLLFGLGGIYVWYLMGRMINVPLVPERDPRLDESLAFENV